MFNSVSGRITEKRPGQLFIENSGIEWDITMPDSSLARLGPPGAQTRIFVYLHHRDDQMRLFGFAAPEERTLFLELLKVEGVGPRQAIRILSGGTIEQFILRLDQGDADALAQLPGIGKKTAQKIVLALRGKLSLESEGGGQGYEEISTALIDMGFDRRRSVEAVAAVVEEIQRESPKPPSEEEILKRAILRLSGSDR
ncbi:MAG TPA: Holliday junction branch migration protein RuvA [Spirochaetia bacterium]|nr:Holliday junction branch migration protein RuvA [Spirochaetia bacterium]